MSALEDLLAPCVFCGDDPAPFLYTTPVCRACAPRSEVRIETHDGRVGVSLVRDDGRWHWLTYFDRDSEQARMHLEPVLERRRERLSLIVSGRSSDEDPAFLARIGDYMAQVGDSPSAMHALRRRLQAAEAAAAIAEAERLLGLRV